MRDKLRELDLGLLETLEALLRTRSVTIAAEELDVSQSAVSHALARLRTLFGDPLLVRSGRAMVPTPRGTELGGPVAQILSLSQSVLAPAVAFDPADARRTITLCLDDMGELAVLPQLMSDLHTAAPSCAIEILSAEGAGFEPILNGARVDLGIAGRLEPGADVLHQRLYRHTFTIIASEACPLRDAIDAEAYLALDHVLFSPHGTARSWVRAFLEEHAASGRIRVSTPHSLMIPLLVEREPRLVAVVPLLLAETFTRFARVKILRPAFDLPRVDVYQYWHRRFDADPFNRWLRAFVRERLFEHPALHRE